MCHKRKVSLEIFILLQIYPRQSYFFIITSLFSHKNAPRKLVFTLTFGVQYTLVIRIAFYPLSKLAYSLFNRDTVAIITYSVIIHVLYLIGNYFLTFRANPLLIDNLLHVLISFFLHISRKRGKILQESIYYEIL